MTKRKSRKRRKSGQGRKSAKRASTTSVERASPYGSLLGSEPSRERPAQAAAPTPPLPARSPARTPARRSTQRPRTNANTPSTAHELMRHQQPPRLPAAPAVRTPARTQRPAHSEKLTLAQIYEMLAALLVPYARKMESEMHPKIGFCLKARSVRTGRETHFGAVQALPDGVAFHLFPLYGHPDLLQSLTPNLFNRMRGKTCFHFEDLDAGVVAELAELTHAGFERFLADGVL